MHIGFIGLGKMGGNMVLRLAVGPPAGSANGTHRVTGFARDPNPELTAVPNVKVVPAIDEMLADLPTPRVVWVMVPAGDPTESVITELRDKLRPGDVVIDGGNSFYKDSKRRAQALAARGIGFLDVGTSGGIWGRAEGYCMMVGGDADTVALARPILDTLAPTDGWIHTGPAGSGHFVKMIHNGIEYGLMEAYGEGFEILRKSEFPLDLHRIAHVWNRGSVVRSWLLELAERMLDEDPTLQTIQPYVEDSGEGRWTVAAAIEENAPAPVIAASLFARFQSRDPENFTARFAAALRKQFGGHSVVRNEVTTKTTPEARTV